VRKTSASRSSGVKCRPFRRGDASAAADVELQLLAVYLTHICATPDFEQLDHTKWRTVVKALSGSAAPSSRRS